MYLLSAPSDSQQKPMKKRPTSTRCSPTPALHCNLLPKTRSKPFFPLPSPSPFMTTFPSSSHDSTSARTGVTPPGPKMVSMTASGSDTAGRSWERARMRAGRVKEWVGRWGMAPWRICVRRDISDMDLVSGDNVGRGKETGSFRKRS